jgi:hypothetical protein
MDEVVVNYVCVALIVMACSSGCHVMVGLMRDA